MTLTLIETKQNQFDVKDGNQYLGWFCVPNHHDNNEFGFVHSDPFSINGDQLIAIGKQLNKLNSDLKRPPIRLI